jgi:hypothetical protein
LVIGGGVVLALLKASLGDDTYEPNPALSIGVALAGVAAVLFGTVLVLGTLIDAVSWLVSRSRGRGPSR